MARKSKSITKTTMSEVLINCFSSLWKKKPGEEPLVLPPIQQMESYSMDYKSLNLMTLIWKKERKLNFKGLGVFACKVIKKERGRSSVLISMVVLKTL